MRTTLTAGLLTLSFVLQAACSMGTTTQLIGTPKQEDPEEAAKFYNGQWLFGGRAYDVNYMGDGRLRIAALEWEEDQYVLHQMTAVITEYEGVTYAHLLFTDDPADPPVYQFVRLAYGLDKPGALLLFPAESGAFRKAIENNQLHGQLVSYRHLTTFEIEGSQEELLRFIQERGSDTLFDLNAAIVVRKITPID